MNDDKIGLSRRKMLVGLGAVGVASAGAGLGTTAYFNDTESFEDNTLTAGELDLFVHVDYSEDQGSYSQYSTPDGTFIDGGVAGLLNDDDADGAVVPGEPLNIQVSDLKPGDSGEGEFCFSIVDNPAYMWMCGEVTANDENGQNEPEMNSSDDTTDVGELADAMQVTVSYCTADGETGEEIISGSLADVMSALDNGVPLSGDGDADAPIADRPAFEGVDAPFDDNDEPVIAEQCVCFEWEVPFEVGNEIQSDSVEFDFEFYAVQSRHNDGSANPCITSREVEGFGKEDYADADVLWATKARNGGSNTFELIVGDDNTNADTADYDFGGSSFDGEVTVAYDADSGEATLEVANGTTTEVSYPVSNAAGDVISIVARGNDASHLASVSNVRVNGSAPTGSDAVEADGAETVSLLIEDVDASADWELTADVAFEGLDNDPSASDENPAVYVEVIDA